MQIICTSLQTDKHASTSPLSFYRPDAFLPPNQQCQSTEGKQNKFTKMQNKHKKLKPGLVTSYDIRPENGKGLFLFWCFINFSITYLLRHLPIYFQLRDPHGAQWHLFMQYFAPPYTYICLKIHQNSFSYQ